MRSLSGKHHHIVRLGVALMAGAALLLFPASRQTPEPPTPAAAQLWPSARRGTVPANLPDGTAYEPGMFLDADTSIGSTPSRDGKYMRLVVRGTNGSVRELRRVPIAQNPSFGTPTVAGDVLVWTESTRRGQALWAASLGTRRSVRQLTAEIGDARFYQTDYDLVIANGRVHWVAAATPTSTEIRSVSVTGGPVTARTETGTWALTAWPWLADGWADISGAGRLRNLITGQEVAMPMTRLGTTSCTPVWCQVVSLDDDASPQIEVVRTDGTDRRRIARGTVGTVIADAVVLDRFTVFCRITPASKLTGRPQLLVYDISTNRTAEISPAASAVSYRAGVLWWSTGVQDSFVRHVLDLRTV